MRNRRRYLNIKYNIHIILYTYIMRIICTAFRPRGDGRDTTFLDYYHHHNRHHHHHHRTIIVGARVEAPKELTTHVRVIIIGRVVYRPSVVLPCAIQLVRACVCNRCTNRRKQHRVPTRSGSREIYLSYFF